MNEDLIKKLFNLFEEWIFKINENNYSKVLINPYYFFPILFNKKVFPLIDE